MKIPSCLSDFYYLIGHWFTILIIILVFVTCPIMFEITPTNYEILAFLTCASIAFVGVAADYKDKFVYPIHVGAAFIAFGSSLFWNIFIFPLSCSCLWIAVIGYVDKQRWLLWCELSCFLSIYVTIFYKLFLI